jgi:TonB family protein
MDRTASYHVRILRARLATSAAGSALFRSDEVIVPLSEREMWGRADQAEAVREALGASAVEALPGLVVREGPAADGGPHRFRAGLGESVVDISFEAEELPGGWHRVHVSASGDDSREILDATLRIRSGATTALAAPLSGGPEGETLVLGLTPLPRHPATSPEKDVPKLDDTVTPPKRIVSANPVYPEAAKKDLVQGRVVMDVVVRRDGRPDGLVVVKMPEGGEWLAGSAVEAVSKWRWQPALKNGKPIDVSMTLVVEFRLDK